MFEIVDRHKAIFAKVAIIQYKIYLKDTYNYYNHVILCSCEWFAQYVSFILNHLKSVYSLMYEFK